jgi:alkylhydroperoxidase/carboxymuconolactone decarboxylase family protein YurZ
MPKVKALPPIGELQLILTPHEISLIRQGYQADPAWLADYPQATYGAMYPGGANAFDSFVQSLYVHGKTPRKPPTTGINGADRERSIIAVLASQGNASFLAIHFYWGLAEGLSVNDMCQVILITGGYSGYSYYTNGLSVLATTLKALKSSVDDGLPLTPQDALAAIQHAFAP